MSPRSKLSDLLHRAEGGNPTACPVINALDCDWVQELGPGGPDRFSEHGGTWLEEGARSFTLPCLAETSSKRSCAQSLFESLLTARARLSDPWRLPPQTQTQTQTQTQPQEEEEAEREERRRHHDHHPCRLFCHHRRGWCHRQRLTVMATYLHTIASTRVATKSTRRYPGVVQIYPGSSTFYGEVMRALRITFDTGSPWHATLSGEGWFCWAPGSNRRLIFCTQATSVGRPPSSPQPLAEVLAQTRAPKAFDAKCLHVAELKRHMLTTLLWPCPLLGGSSVQDEKPKAPRSRRYCSCSLN